MNVVVTGLYWFNSNVSIREGICENGDEHLCSMEEGDFLTSCVSVGRLLLVVALFPGHSLWVCWHVAECWEGLPVLLFCGSISYM